MAHENIKDPDWVNSQKAKLKCSLRPGTGLKSYRTIQTNCDTARHKNSLPSLNTNFTEHKQFPDETDIFPNVCKNCTVFLNAFSDETTRQALINSNNA